MVESKGGLVDVGESWRRLYPQGGKLQIVVFTHCQKIQMILLKRSSCNLIILILFDDNRLLILKIGDLDALYILHHLHFIATQDPNDFIIILNVHLLHKGLVKQRIREKVTNFLVRGLSKAVIDHLLMLVRIIIFPLQPLQILQHTPRDIRSQIHSYYSSPIHHRTILISLQPAPPSLVDDPIKQVISMQVLK
jgi:hypothetical protein